MNLLRLLPGGTEAKLLVDNAIDSCTPIGNVREDIYRCPHRCLTVLMACFKLAVVVCHQAAVC